MKAADLTKSKFGMLTVIQREGSDVNGKAQWRCVCECGESVLVLAQHLKAGNTRTCGQHGHLATPMAAQLPERYRIVAVDGPRLGTQSSAYGYCEVIDVDARALLFRNEPLSRLETGGEPSPNAARGMVWLQQQGLIEPRRNMTWRQWLIAARCTIELRQISAVDSVVAAWELTAGRPLREQRPEQPSFLPTIQQIPDTTPAQQFRLDAFLADESDGSDHLERFPVSDVAKRDIMLAQARKRDRDN